MTYEERRTNILIERAKIAQFADGDPEWQAALLKKCKNDPLFWINHFAFTHDPRLERKPHHHAFVLYDFQEEFIKWLDSIYNQQSDGLIEKSRDMGATWLIMSWALWHWLFDDNFQFLAGSRKEDYVDKTDSASSLMYKTDYILKRLPKWMLPLGFDLNSKKSRTHLQLLNPKNHNVIAGEATNPDFARGGRFSAILFDEFAFWDFARTAWSSAGDSSPVRIALSTPPETGAGYFKELRFSGRTPVKTLHWRQHPLKTEEWYKQEEARRTEEEVAVNLDISYEPTSRGRVYPEFDMVPIKRIDREPSWPLFVTWDYGVNDNCAMIWLQRDPVTGVAQVIDTYTNNNKEIRFYIPFVNGTVDPDFEYTSKELKIIERHKSWRHASHFGDPAGKQRSQVTNTSVIDELRKAGIHVKTNDKANKFPPRREATKQLMRRFEVDENQHLFIDSMKNARYPQRAETSQAVTPVTKPVHDWTSHYRTSIEYYAVNEKTPRQRFRINTLSPKRKEHADEILGDRIDDAMDRQKPGRRRRIIRALRRN